MTGTSILYGTIARLLEGLFAAPLGLAVPKTAIAPRQVALLRAKTSKAQVAR